MRPTDRLVLVDDLLMVPVASFAPDIREQLAGSPDDYVLMRRSSRARSMLIDAGSAAFLERFRHPTAVVDAVLDYAVSAGDDPEKLVEVAGKLIARLRSNRFIAVAGDTLAISVTPSLRPGTLLQELEVLDCVHLFDDVELYRCSSRLDNEVALKILRKGARLDARRMLAREALVLAHLDGYPAPRLHAKGELDGRPYVVQSWCDGTTATRAAASRRTDSTSARAVFSLCRAAAWGGAVPGKIQRQHELSSRCASTSCGLTPNCTRVAWSMVTSTPQT